MNTVIIKLLNGENIIGDVDNDFLSHEFFNIKNPMRLNFVPHPRSGTIMLSILPWFGPAVSLQRDFNVNRNHVISYVTNISDDLLINYEKSVMSFYMMRQKRAMMDEDDTSDINDNPDMKEVNGIKLTQEELSQALDQWDTEDETPQ